MVSWHPTFRTSTAGAALVCRESESATSYLLSCISSYMVFWHPMSTPIYSYILLWHPTLTLVLGTSCMVFWHPIFTTPCVFYCHTLHLVLHTWFSDTLLSVHPLLELHWCVGSPNLLHFLLHLFIYGLLTPYIYYSICILLGHPTFGTSYMVFCHPTFLTCTAWATLVCRVSESSAYPR